MDVHALTAAAIATLIAVAWKLVGAIVLWLVGRWLIRFAGRLVGRALSQQHVDATLARYFQTGLSVVLNVALVVAILGFFGVETTTFAALVAAGGVAIGVAWGGLLANFAAGAFLVFLRPFKVGDFVSAGGVTGTVDAIGLFGTTINTPDNVLTIVGNNKVFSDNIQNFSANPLPARGSDRDDQQRRRSSPRDQPPEGSPEDHSERAGLAGAGRRRPAVHARRARCCASGRSARTTTTGRCTSTRTGWSARRSAKRDSRRPCPRTRSPACRPRRSKPQAPDSSIFSNGTTINTEHAEHAESPDAAPRSGGAGPPIANERRLSLVGVRPRLTGRTLGLPGQAARVERFGGQSRLSLRAPRALRCTSLSL